MKKRNIPFGYRMEQGQIKIHRQEAKVIKEIYALYEQGNSYLSIAQALIARQVPYSDSPVWNKNNVKRILENAKYIGESGYPPILPTDQFEWVQALIKSKTENWTYREKTTDTVDENVITYIYEPSAEVIRLRNEINRKLTKPLGPAEIRRLIQSAAAERYQCLIQEKK